MSKHWDTPDEPPAESKLTAQCDMILGGRFLFEYLAGTSNGMPFEGAGVVGFDNVTRKFVMSWVDNMGTGTSGGEGSRSPDGKRIVWSWTTTDPVSGRRLKRRSVENIVSDDHFVVEMFGVLAPDTDEVKVMELVYTRANPAGAE